MNNRPYNERLAIAYARARFHPVVWFLFGCVFTATVFAFLEWALWNL